MTDKYMDKDFKFAVSSTAFRGQKIEEVIDLARNQNLALEFSSGLPYRPDMSEIFINANCDKYLHNYFPAPKEPFVLNLASLNSEIWEKSVNHATQCMHLAAKTRTPFYSIHAGFCLDPDPKSLGKKLNAVPQAPREKYWDRFLLALEKLLKTADELDINLLIENNVIAPFNMNEDKIDPLLCTRGNEILRMLEEMRHPRLKVLIDTGHWKVSAKTLGFDLSDDFISLAPHVQCFHHSDNLGTADTNMPFDSSYWFLPFAHHFSDALHVLEVHDQSVSEIRRQQNLLKGAIGGNA